MVQVGNKTYRSRSDIPDIVPIFPLSGALLLPGGNMPLNIFEPRYLAMTDHALCTDRLIGMIQPNPKITETNKGPGLFTIGCLGRITGFQETGDGRYMINLTGISRFEVIEEVDPLQGFRCARIKTFENDLHSNLEAEKKSDFVNRELLLDTFRKYLEANDMDTDWGAVERTDDATLVTALCMMSPYGPAEKQALLEAETLFVRAETLVAITEIALAKESEKPGSNLQ